MPRLTPKRFRSTRSAKLPSRIPDNHEPTSLKFAPYVSGVYGRAMPGGRRQARQLSRRAIPGEMAAPYSSEDKPCAELHLPRWSRRGPDYAERRTKCGVRNIKVGMVENVERLGAELDLALLPDREILGQAKIQ